MLLNDLIAMLEDLPRTLAAGWASWLFVGLLLSMWQRRDSRRLVVLAPTPRPKSGVRAPARSVKSVPMSSGDAFGELEALLEPPSGSHRLPGEGSPVLAEPSRPAAPVGAPPTASPRASATVSRPPLGRPA